MSDTILVTGATGNTGTQVTGSLRAAGATVRTASRRPPRTPDGAHVPFDWADTATHPAAVRGVRRMYLVAPVGVADPVRLVEPFLRTALDHGLRRVVLLSSSAVRSGDAGLGQVDHLVRSTIPEWTVLRPSWFMQNFVGDHPVANGIRATGEIVTATGDGRLGFVDAADIAAVGARALLDERAHNTEHVITGPETLSYAQAAQVVTEVTGRPVRHVSVSTEELTSRLAEAGYPPEFAAALAGLDEDIRQGREDYLTDTVHRITGRAPRSLRAFLTEHRAALAP